ncbi:tyrosine-type recombinase/integrase [Rhizobium ruizarguesonis]
MARPRNKISSKAVVSLPPGKYCDGGGLWLFKRADGGGQWVLRYQIHGVRREMGLGSTLDVSLKKAREEAEKWRDVKVDNRDPIKVRRNQRRDEVAKVCSLRDIAIKTFESRKSSLKGDGKAGRWFSPLELHVLPKLGKMPVTEVDQKDVRDVLAPIWHTKADTARKALQRLGLCMEFAAALGLNVDQLVTKKARALLGKTSHKSQNIPSLPWPDLPNFYKTLSEPTITHLALRLLILTGVRSLPLRLLHEKHLDGNIWTIPGALMKGPKDETPDFRVPLVPEAMEVIELARRHSRNGLLFPGERKGVISDQTMSQHLSRAGLDARPHGFRSTLKTWIEETTITRWEVSEITLGHIVGGKVERAYRRTDYLPSRRRLLQQWALYATGQAVAVVIDKDE